MHTKAHAQGQGRVGMYHVHEGRREFSRHSSTKNREECMECLGMGVEWVRGPCLFLKIPESLSVPR